MRKINIFFIFLISFLALISINSISADSYEDWHSDLHNYRIPLVVRGDLYVNSSVENLPVFISLNLSDYWNNNGNDDENDLVIYGHSKSGTKYGSFVECPYEIIRYTNNSVYDIYFKAPFVRGDEGNNSKFYAFFWVYIDNDSDENNENASAVWTDAYAVYHLEDNTDSSGNSRTLTSVGGYTINYATGVFGNAFSPTVDYPASTNWLKYDNCNFIGNTSSGDHTVVMWMKEGYNPYSNSVHYVTVGANNTDIYSGFWVGTMAGATPGQTARFATSEGYYDWCYDQNSNTDPIFVSGFLSGSSNSWYFNLQSDNSPNSIYEVGSNPNGSLTVGRPVVSGTYGMQKESFVDELWLISDLKTEDWTKLIYYNSNYGTLVSYDFESDPSELPGKVPVIENPSESGETYYELSTLISWSEEDVEAYELVYANNSNFDNNTTNSYITDYTIMYLPNGTYYLDVRSEIEEGNYSEWFTSYEGDYYFIKTDKPVFSSPTNESTVTTAIVEFNWNDISGITSYDIQVATDENFSNLVFDTTSSISEKDLTFEDNDDYFVRVRGKDNYFTGSWSDTLEFTLEFSEVPFTFDFDLVNHYAGEQNFVCYFTGLESYVEYEFNINRLNADGTFNSLITTLTVTGDEANEGDFGYTFSTGANYPFSVTFPDGGNAELGRFYVQPVPSNFWTTAPHRTIIDPWQTGLAVGPVAYNSKSGQLMHDATKSTQSLYEQDEYIILNYQIPRPSVQNCSIIFKNIATLEEVLEIDGRDLYNYNGGMGYGEVNFIVIPLNGEIPDIVDYNVATDFNFVGDDWFTKTFSKGAYYYYIDLGDDNYTYGESNLLIGNDTDEEWTLDTDKDTYVNGEDIIYTITYNTEEIWDAYKYTLLYDASSQEYIIGQSIGGVYPRVYSTEVYPGAFVSSNIIGYIVSNKYLDSGYSWIGFWPEAVTTTTNTGYEYYVTTTYLITEPTDVTDGLDDFLNSLGLGTPVGKLILAMVILIGSLIVLAIVGMPNIVLIISAVAIFIILIAIGLIPIWVAIILGIVLFLKAISGFSGGGGE